MLFFVSFSSFLTNHMVSEKWCDQHARGGGGGGILPYKGLMGTCCQPGSVFRDFCLKQGIDFINFCFKQGIFSRTINSLRDSVDQAVNSFVIANGLNKKEFRYLLLSYTGYGFGLNVLNRVSKIGILS